MDNFVGLAPLLSTCLFLFIIASSQALENRGGTVTSNAGDIQWECDQNNHNGLTVFVLTGADVHCGSLELTVHEMSPESMLHLYDGSHLQEQHTCGMRISAAAIGTQFITNGSMATLVLNQEHCSVEHPRFSCSWTCIGQNPNELPFEEHGAFVVAENGMISYSDLNSVKRYTSAIISDREVCLRVESDFAPGNTTNTCESSRLGVHQIENDGCLNKIHNVCGRRSSFKAANVGPNLLAVATLNPYLALSSSQSYEIYWNEGECPSEECETPVTGSPSSSTTGASTSTSNPVTYSTGNPSPSTTEGPTSSPTTSTSEAPGSSTSSTDGPTAGSSTTEQSTTEGPTTGSTGEPYPTSSTGSPTSTSTTAESSTSTTASPSTVRDSTTIPDITYSTTASTTADTETPITTGTPEPSSSTPNPGIVSTECGGVIYIPCESEGKIIYKNGTNYANNEVCDWVIHSPTGLVDVSFVSYHFEPYYDGIVIGSYNTHKPEFGCYKMQSIDYSRSLRVATPAVLHFTSDYSVTRPGFEIRLVPSGDNCIDKYNTDLVHTNSTGGTYHYPATGTTYLNQARPLAVIQANTNHTMREFSYSQMDLEEYYDCTQIMEFGQYSSNSPCVDWDRICGWYPPETFRSNMTANSVATYMWSDRTYAGSGYTLQWAGVNSTAPTGNAGNSVDESLKERKSPKMIF